MFSEVILQRFLIFEKTTIIKEKNLGKFYFSLKWSCYIFSLKLFDCAQVALLFPGNDAEWPMCCRNVDSFLFRQILGSRFVHFLAKVMPKCSMNFGMTCATN